MEHMVQPGALRWVPGRAGVPRKGRGEAPVQHPKPNSRANSQAQPALFAGGGEGEHAPPRRRRRAALGPMPYGNLGRRHTHKPENRQRFIALITLPEDG